MANSNNTVEGEIIIENAKTIIAPEFLKQEIDKALETFNAKAQSIIEKTKGEKLIKIIENAKTQLKEITNLLISKTKDIEGIKTTNELKDLTRQYKAEIPKVKKPLTQRLAMCKSLLDVLRDEQSRICALLNEFTLMEETNDEKNKSKISPSMHFFPDNNLQEFAFFNIKERESDELEEIEKIEENDQKENKPDPSPSMHFSPDNNLREWSFFNFEERNEYENMPDIQSEIDFSSDNLIEFLNIEKNPEKCAELIISKIIGVLKEKIEILKDNLIKSNVLTNNEQIDSNDFNFLVKNFIQMSSAIKNLKDDLILYLDDQKEAYPIKNIANAIADIKNFQKFGLKPKEETAQLINNFYQNLDNFFEKLDLKTLAESKTIENSALDYSGFSEADPSKTKDFASKLLIPKTVEWIAIRDQAKTEKKEPDFSDLDGFDPSKITKEEEETIEEYKMKLAKKGRTVAVGKSRSEVRNLLNIKHHAGLSVHANYELRDYIAKDDFNELSENEKKNKIIIARTEKLAKRAEKSFRLLALDPLLRTIKDENNPNKTFALNLLETILAEYNKNEKEIDFEKLKQAYNPNTEQEKNQEPKLQETAEKISLDGLLERINLLKPLIETRIKIQGNMIGKLKNSPNSMEEKNQALDSFDQGLKKLRNSLQEKLDNLDKLSTDFLFNKDPEKTPGLTDQIEALKKQIDPSKDEIKIKEKERQDYLALIQNRAKLDKIFEEIKKDQSTLEEAKKTIQSIEENIAPNLLSLETKYAIKK